MSFEDFNSATDVSVGSSIPKVQTGIRGLDDILMGGLPQGRTTIINGTAGTGKTVMAMEFLYRGALAGEPGLFISFEERAGDIRINAAAMGIDIASLEEEGKFRVIHAELPLDAVNSGEFDTSGLLAMIEGHAGLIGAKRIVLDAIDVFMSIFGDPRREREEISILHNRMRDLGMTTILTVKAGSEGRMIYPFLDFMADCVLFLDQRVSGQVRTRRLNVLKYRGSDFLSNEHPYVFSPNGIVLMPVSSLALEQLSFRKRVSSGHSRMDEILGGGYFVGSSILLAGPSGAGKTSLACIFAHAACNKGEKVLYVDFEVAREALVGAMRSIGLDLRLALDADSRLRIHTAMPESMGIEEHLLRIIDEMTLFSPHHLVVDAISACRRMGSERAAFDFVVRLMTECKSRGITCFYTNQIVNDQDPTYLSGLGLSSLVDTLIALEYFFEGQSLSRRLMVIKSRGTHHSMDFHQMNFTDHGLELKPIAGKTRRISGSEGRA